MRTGLPGSCSECTTSPHLSPVIRSCDATDGPIGQRPVRRYRDFFNDPATTEISTLSLHDALPIWFAVLDEEAMRHESLPIPAPEHRDRRFHDRSEEHTSELQSPPDLVCRLLL